MMKDATNRMTMRSFLIPVLLLVLPTMTPAQTPKSPQVSVTYRYADVADLALAASVVAHVKIKKAERIKGKLAEGVASDKSRYLVTANLIALIAAPSPMAKRLTYLIDLPTDSQARIATPLKGEVVAFAQPGRPGELRLVAPDGHIVHSAELGQMVRSILAEANKPDAPPAIARISYAYHTPGALIGEGDTQIFLESAAGKPISLNIRRRTDSPPSWFAATGETVDEGGLPPRRNSLLWYRLACSLPQVLPTEIGESLDEAARTAVVADYKFIMQSLGSCQRARTPVR
jgi:hypothetical protein